MAVGRILIVEDDDGLRHLTQVQLERNGHQVWAAVDVAEALALLRSEPVDLVISDLNLPDVSGLELLKQIRCEYPETTVIIMTAYGTIETAVEAMRLGGYEYITKPVHPDALKLLVSRALERRELLDEARLLRSAIDQKSGFENIIGQSQALLRALEAASLAASTDATVLIRGETGTGKELLAKAIHFSSSRRDRPFVIINCGSIPSELLESELFGHVKGSFSGAVTHKTGKVETADGGTLMLDEISEMPLDLQIRVLRLLEEHEIEKVGSTRPLKVDVRIIATTHRDLESLVALGTFREDLYYRLAVIPLILPPLRDRQEDIPLLVERFFHRSKLKHGRPGIQLPASLMSYFVNYEWPSNIRELENVIERITILSRSDEVSLADLPQFLRQGTALTEPQSHSLSLEAVEREMIVQALRKFDWNQTQAARYLDISRKNLMYRMAKYGVEGNPSKELDRTTGGVSVGDVGVVPQPLLTPENLTQKLAIYQNIVRLALHDLKNEFLHISHAAKNLTEIVEPSATAHDEIDMIDRSLAGARSAVRRVHTFLELGGPNRGPLPISQLLFDTQSQLKDRLRQNIRIEVDLSPAVGERRVFVDQDQILTILLELIGNAIRAIGKGPGSIFLGAKLIDHCCHVTVKDTGPGIPERLRPALLKTQLRSEHGAGLGLYLSARVMRALGGELLLVSSSTAGTEFRVVLPLAPKDEHSR